MGYSKLQTLPVWQVIHAQCVLQWLRSFPEPEDQVARWLETLSEYDLMICIVWERSTQVQIHCHACHALSVGCHLTKTVKTLNVCWQCVLAMTQSRMPLWTSEELVSHQRQNPDLKQVIAWLETRSIPLLTPVQLSADQQRKCHDHISSLASNFNQDSFTHNSMLPKDYTEHKLQLEYYMGQCAIDIRILLYMHITLQ